MQAHRMKVTVPDDHQLEIRLPEDFPAGPAEVIFLTGSPGKERSEAQRDLRRSLQEIRSLQWTPEEERVLDEFEEFRRRYPIDFSRGMRLYHRPMRSCKDCRGKPRM